MDFSNKAILIIDQSIKLNDLFKEVKSSSALNELTLLEYVELYSSTTDVNRTQAISNILVAELYKLNQHFHVFLDIEKFNLIHNLVNLFCKEKCENCAVIEVISSLKNCLPLNVLNILNQKNVALLETFLKENISNHQILKQFLHGLQCLSIEKNTDLLEASTELLSVIINYGYSQSQSDQKAFKKLCQYLLHKVFEHILLKVSEVQNEQAKRVENAITLICKSDFCSKEVLKIAFRQQIIIWGTRNPAFKVSDAVCQQNKWKYCCQSTWLVTTLREILMCIGMDNTIEAFMSIIEKKEINWKNFLIFTSNVAINFKETSSPLYEALRKELIDGMKNQRIEGLVIGFLMARQLSQEGQHLFSTYTFWFQNFFTNGSKCLINSLQDFKFLIKFLTTLVPFEPAQYLKVHISNQFRSTKFPTTDIMREYVTLAKTRLLDLRDSQAEEDHATVLLVENVIQTWEKTSKVPKVVLEASIFRKHFFIESFLPLLLKPRTLPEEEDSKMKLISVLVKNEKIPKPLYANYLSACEKEKEELMKSFVEEMELDEFVSEDELISNLKQLIIDHLTNEESTDDTCQKIHKCFYEILQDFRIDKQDEVIENSVINLTNNSINCLPQNKVCKVADAVSEALSGLTVKLYSRLVEFTTIITNYQVLHLYLCVKIWKTLDQGLNEVPVNSVNLILAGALHDQKWNVKYYRIIEKDTYTDCFSTAFFHTVQCKVGFLDAISFQNNLIQIVDKLIGFSFSSTTLILMFIYNNLKFANLRFSAFKSSYSDSIPFNKRRKLQLEGKWSEDKIISLTNSTRKSVEIIIDNFQKTRINFNALEYVDNISREIWINEETDFLRQCEKYQFYEDILYSDALNVENLEEVFILFLENWNDVENLQFTTYFCENILFLFKSCKTDSNISIGKWFLNIWEKKIVQGRSQYDNALCVLQSVLTKLPPKFLFVQNNDCLMPFSVSTVTGYCEVVATIVNKHMSNKTWSSSNISDNLIPVSLVSNLFQGVLEIVSEKDTMPLLNYLIDDIALLFISLVVHWRNMAKLQMICKRRYPWVYEVISSFYESVLCSKSCVIQKPKNVVKNLSGNNMPVVISICTLALHQNDIEPKMEITKILENFSQLRAVSSNFMGSVIAVSASMESYNGLSDKQTSWYASLIDEVMSYMNGDVILHCLTNVNPTFRCCFNKSVCDLYYFSSALRLVSTISLPSKVLSHPNALNTILRLTENTSSIIKVNMSKLHSLLSTITHSSTVISITSAIQDLNIDAVTKSILKIELLKRNRR